MRIELLQLPEKSHPPAIETWRRFFDFASVTNNPHCFYDPDIEGRFARDGAWDEAKAAVLMALGNTLLSGRVDPRDLRMVAEGRKPEDALRSLGLAIHSGTTRSIQRALVVALDRARNCTRTKHPTLLTTDFEYPGIVTAIDEIWDGPVFVARLKARLHDVSGAIPELFVRAVRTVRPDVIYISHVDRYTGFVFPWDVLMEIAGKGQDPPIVIVDGAQAAGNVDLTECFRLKPGEGPHLYAASAHKFLCALPTLGLLIALRDDLGDWEIEDKAVAYSFGHGARGTGSIESMASLARSAYRVLAESRSACDTFLNRLEGGPWTVVEHRPEHRSGLFQISTKDRRVALRLERLLQRRSENVGYHIASLSGAEKFLDRGIERRNERLFLNIENGDWCVEENWRDDVKEMKKESDVSASYRVSIHPRLHSPDDVKQLCDFLNDPRSWRDRTFTRFELMLAKRLKDNDVLWKKLIRRNIRFLLDERFPKGPWGASYHATCQQLIIRENFESSGRDRIWREGGVANTYYALRGLRPYYDVVKIEEEIAEHWSGRIGDLRRIIGVRSAARPTWCQERWRHAFFAYLACVESEERLEPSPLTPLRVGQQNAIRQWIRDDVMARPDEELAFSGDDWPFGGLCVLHRVLRDLQPESRAEDLVMQRLGEQLVAGANGLSSSGSGTPSQLGPIFLSSAHAFSTLVDGRILDGPVPRDEVTRAIRSLCERVKGLTTPFPRFTNDGPPSISAAFAALSFLMWPWLDEIWGREHVPHGLLQAVEKLIDWIEDHWTDEGVYNDIWSEFHGSFLALDVVQQRNYQLNDADQANLDGDDRWMLPIRTNCEIGRPSNTPYDPVNDPRIFASL